LGKVQRAQQLKSYGQKAMQYRRSHQPGGRYFFTLVTHQRQPLLSIPENIDRLRTAFKREMEKQPFTIDAIVILPDHLHTLWTLPEGDAEYSTRWNRIKRYFSVGCTGAQAKQSISRHKKREKPVWQRRFWEHTIRDENDWRGHMDYIHYNPVKHGHARTAGEWPYSSFKRCVQKGWYPPDWGATEPESIKGIEYE
jgi:putative transposase